MLRSACVPRGTVLLQQVLCLRAHQRTGQEDHWVRPACWICPPSCVRALIAPAFALLCTCFAPLCC